MKLKASQIIDMVTALNNIADKEVPLTLAIKVADVIDSLETSYDQITKRRDDLVRKFGEKNEDGEVLVQDNGTIKIFDFKSFQTEEAELLNTEIDLKFETLSMEDLKQCDIQISPKDYRALKPILK